MEKLQNCLVLADGTVLPKSSCGYSDKNLWCWVSGKTMAECFALFTDPLNLQTIECYYVTEKYIYKGFTEMILIQKSETGLGEPQIDIRLTWPEGGEHSVEVEDLNDDE